MNIVCNGLYILILYIELDDPVLFDDIHSNLWDKVQHDTSISHYGMHHHKNTYQTIDSCQHHLNYKVCMFSIHNNQYSNCIVFKNTLIYNIIYLNKNFKSLQFF